MAQSEGGEKPDADLSPYGIAAIIASFLASRRKASNTSFTTTPALVSKT